MNIVKIAEIAGVSIATVSRVINKSELVSDKTKKKVLNAITTSGYQPNLRAREFRMKRSYEIITILNDIRNPIFGEAIKGMEDVAYERGYHLLIGNTGNNEKREREYLDSLKMGKADGAILITPRISKQKLLELNNQVPLVLMNDHIKGDSIPSVGINDYGASYDLTSYIIERGHRCIGYIFGNQKATIAKERKKGFEMAMRDHRCIIQKEWLLESQHTTQGGHEVAKQLLALDERPTAVICYNDEIAIGVIKYLQLKGLEIPTDLSVLGFDNISTSTIVSPALTTIHQPTFEIGKKSMELLISHIEGKEVLKKRITLSYTLLERDSHRSK